MTRPVRQAPPAAPLDPALLRIVRAMARAQAARDFAQARACVPPADGG